MNEQLKESSTIFMAIVSWCLISVHIAWPLLRSESLDMHECMAIARCRVWILSPSGS